MECSCIAPLTPVVMVMRGLVFHPLFCMVSISGSYLVVLVHEGLFGKPVVAVCKFDELDCACEAQ